MVVAPVTGRKAVCAICGEGHGTMFHPATEYPDGSDHLDPEGVTKPECPNALRGEPAPLPPPYDRQFPTGPGKP